MLVGRIGRAQRRNEDTERRVAELVDALGDCLLRARRDVSTVDTRLGERRLDDLDGRATHEDVTEVPVEPWAKNA